jgi:hypothetical protein
VRSASSKNGRNSTEITGQQPEDKQKSAQSRGYPRCKPFEANGGRLKHNSLKMKYKVERSDVRGEAESEVWKLRHSESRRKFSWIETLHNMINYYSGADGVFLIISKDIHD